MNTLDQSAIQLNSILFAIDFTPGCLHAFPFAVSIARHYAGTLLLEHVSPGQGVRAIPDQNVTLKQLQSEMEAALAHVSVSLEGIAHEIHFDHGNISARLLDTAKQRHTDLIVVGTNGLRGVRKLWKGSTAEQIVFLSSCPVLTAGPNVDRRPDFRRILCATDFSAAARNAIPYALSLAEKYDASLAFLHVNDWSSTETPVQARPKTFEFVHEQLGHSIQGTAIESRCQVFVEFGPSSDLILEAATDREADLIVMGRPAVNSFKARIASHLPGSTAYDVIAQAPCPVLTVPLRHAA